MSSRRLFFALGAAALLLLYVLFRGPAAGPAGGTDPGGEARPVRGGHLTATLRAEPRTLNRVVDAAFPTHLLSLLTGARLARIHPVTQEPEPWLAESIAVAPDARSLEVRLRPDLRWSDGAPLTADDVAFSVRAAYEATGSVLGDSLRVNGQPLTVRVDAPDRITLLAPAPYAPLPRLLDALPILPKHVLEGPLAEGTLGARCTPREPCPSAGPFVVSRYDAGERIVLARNPHYWRTGADGSPLPYLDGLTLAIVPDQNAELLRLTSGAVDLTQSEPRAEDIRVLREAAAAGRVRLDEAGPGLDRQMLWFNLGPAPIDPSRGFLRDRRFRQAVSLAVDRRGFADTVFLGAADPSPFPVTAANRAWHAADLPAPAYDPRRAAELLESMGLEDRDRDGVREDAAGRPARFTVLVQAGITAAERGASFLRDALATLGVAVDIVPLDLAAIFGRWGSGEYDAIYHFLQMTDTDPAGNLDFWLSRGSAHLWHPRQAAPATRWEAEIDRLMLAQAASPDREERVRLFREVQRILGEENPAIWFAAPRVFVAYSPRVGGVVPAVTRPQVLWNADELWVK